MGDRALKVVIPKGVEIRRKNKISIIINANYSNTFGNLFPIIVVCLTENTFINNYDRVTIINHIRDKGKRLVRFNETIKEMCTQYKI